jgi:copper(I)-binding protein
VRFAAAAAATVLLLAACGDDGSSGVSELTVERAWARTTPAAATTGVVYLEITSPDDDTIVSAAVPADIAGSAELHETMAAGEGGHSHGGDTADSAADTTAPSGEMVMEPLDEVRLPADTTVVFEPGGLHIMLIDLAAPLELDEEFTLTLTLGSGDQIDVDVVVADNSPE